MKIDLSNMAEESYSKDILILSNAPGELTTWVYPFLKALEISLQSQENSRTKETRISVVLSPCQNASGNEAELVKSFPNVDRVLPQSQFWDFLLWGRTPNWQWSKQGIVIFLGGDQFFTLAIAKRLGYKTLIYAEWQARWYRWIDLFAVRNEAIANKIPAKFRSKAKAIGDLMLDRVEVDALKNIQPKQRICFMPGSKEHKIKIGIPISIAIVDILIQKRPDLEFVIALAPTATPETLAKYAQESFPTADSEGGTATLSGLNLVTAKGTVMSIHREFPAHDLVKSSQICITTAGANTAELASLHQPMMVLLPINLTNTKVGWDGIAGLLAAAPLLGKVLTNLINFILISQIKNRNQLLAWPNIWAKEAIVPEFLGVLSPTQIANEILFYLDNPEELEKMRDRLRKVCGESGAASKLAEMVIDNI
jgi:lipid-A-disaccharide synthase